MCNGKGWDIAYYPEYMTVQQHFCRILDDCGHVDNTLEEAAAQVAENYKKEYDTYIKYRKETQVGDKFLEFLLREHKGWKDLTHPTYLYYKESRND